MSDHLARILAPVSRNEFLNHYLKREYFYVSRNSPGFYEEYLSAAAVDCFLQSEHLPAAFLNVARAGKKQPMEDWSRNDASARGEERIAIPERLLDLYGEGATLILNGVHLAIPSLSSLCRGLSSELGFLTQANVYVTPPVSTGFTRHTDEHEVLVLQVEGIKHWQLFPPHGTEVDLELRAGDLLYLPRGLSHAAGSLDADSIHITIGLHPAYEFELVRQIALFAKETGDLGRPAPPAFADEGTKRSFEADFLTRLRELLNRVTPLDMLERHQANAVRNQRRGWAGRFSDVRRISSISPQTRVSRRPEILVQVKESGKFLGIEFAERNMLVPMFLRGAVELILSGDSFAVGELKGFFTDAGRVKLAREFVRTGLLRIDQL